MKRWYLLGLLIVSIGAHAAPTSLDESFDNLATNGWTLINASSPGGLNWFQGNPGVFNAHSGAPNSYAAASFLSTDPVLGGTISNWLISPEIQFASQVLSFYTRSDVNPGALFGDGLRVLVSLSGASTALSDFTELFNINAANTAGAYPEDWTNFLALLGASGTGRIAFEYTVGPNALANYIGLDTIAVFVPVPEPGTLALLGLALALAGAVARRR